MNFKHNWFFLKIKFPILFYVAFIYSNFYAGDIFELLTAQGQLSDTQQERVRCIAEWESARLRLVANSGSMTRKSLTPLVVN